MTENRLDIMATATWNRNLPAGYNALPCWVPDWVYHEDPAHAKFLTNIGLRKDCEAAKSTHTEVSFPTDTSGIRGRVLQAKGILIGTILDVVGDDHRTSWRTYACKYSPMQYDHATGLFLHVGARNIAQPGDEIWIFYGADHPYVLRSDGIYRTLIGQAMLRVLRVQSLISPASRRFSAGRKSQILYGDLVEW